MTCLTLRRTLPWALLLLAPSPVRGQGDDAASGTPVQAHGALPNVVLVLADDLGYGDPGCYNERSRIPTPHLDRLAAEGLRFTDAHSPSSVCTPTRYGILTGRYAWRTGLQKSVLWPWDPPLLEEARVTLPEFLRAAGYRTACIGKWHLGWDWPLDAESSVRAECPGVSWDRARSEAVGRRVNWDRPLAGGPLAHGFDHYFGDDVPNFPPYAFLEDDRVCARPTTQRPAGMFGHPGPAAPGWDLSAVLPVLTQRAASWIDERGRDPDPVPFFLYLPLTAPHTPIAPSPAHRGSSSAGAYGDYVHQLDACVGEVLAALERTGRTRDTLVLVTSDNGSPQRDGSGMSGAVGSVRERFDHDPSHPWRGLKSDAWEGGHRVPLLVRWPGVTPAGQTCDAPVVLTDLYRTLAGAVGHVPGPEAGEDSFDLGPLLRDPRARPTRDHLVHHSGNGVFAVRIGEWKLILDRGSGGFSRWTPPEGAPEGQLYDLRSDPGESRNLYEERPEVVERLRARLDALRAGGRSTPY